MGCFANFQFDNDSPESDTEMHAWELITEYYRLKNGDSVTNSAAQLLSQSFNLDIVSEGTISNKQVSWNYFVELIFNEIFFFRHFSLPSETLPTCIVLTREATILISKLLFVQV